jgi:hypothetical protein
VKTRPLADRLWEKVDRTGECWLFTGYRNAAGYGFIGYTRGHPIMAHRAAWMVTHGPIPPATLVCHRCDNPSCVRPDHLFLGSGHDNVVDMVRKGRHRPTRGSDSVNAKLAEDDVREIRRFGGTVPDRALAERFGVSQTLIFNIRQRRAWRHVE